MLFPHFVQSAVKVLRTSLMFKGYWRWLRSSSDVIDIHVTTSLRLFTMAARLRNHSAKCHFSVWRVLLLSHNFDHNGLTHRRLCSLHCIELSSSDNFNGIKSLMAICSYNKRFIRDFNRITTPLWATLKRDVLFQWDPACKKSSNNLKDGTLFAFPRRRVVLTSMCVDAPHLLSAKLYLAVTYFRKVHMTVLYC